MSAWLFFALLAPCLFGLANIFDKLLTKRFSALSLNVAAGLVAGLGLLAIPFLDVNLPLLLVIVGLIAGAFWFLGGFPYFRAIAIEEPSRVAPLWQLSVPMTLLLAMVFLDERLPASSYAAMALIFLGAFLVSVKDLRKTLRITPAFWLMLLANALITVSLVIPKWLYGFGSFLEIQTLLLAGNFAAALLMLLASGKVRKEVVRGLKDSGGVRLLFLVRMAVETSAYVAVNLALLMGPASLTVALDGLSGFFVFIAATAISFWRPSLFREELDRKTLLTKAVAISLIMLGLFLLQ
ncbi:EamA family transporter [Candidatus Woesearchaeota archaeon]|nr:EamA family transporter [Candidatus Woesearchaeota archaeon]